MGRAPCCDKDNVKRGPWSPEEDATLKSFVEIHGTGGNWIALPRKAGLKRCGKSCRLRWLNYLRPDIKHGGFTQEEDNVIYALYNQMGSRWSIIASHLPGRTDNDVKNYWNTKLKKKLLVGNVNNWTNSYGNNQNLLPKMETFNHGFMGLPEFGDVGYGGIENSEFTEYPYRPELAAGDVNNSNNSHIGSSNIIDGGIVMDSEFGFGFGFNYENVNGIWFQEKGNEGNSSSYSNLGDFSYGGNGKLHQSVINQY